jgi:hypothetical protein
MGDYWQICFSCQRRDAAAGFWPAGRTKQQIRGDVGGILYDYPTVDFHAKIGRAYACKVDCGLSLLV